MAFWKPGTVAPGSLVDRSSDDVEGGIFMTFSDSKFSTLTIQEQRQRLPIYKSRTDFLYLVEHFQVVVLVGQTGSGKTTQIPQYLHESGWTGQGKVVACTQPRRVAATTVAQRVAEEMNVTLGQEVGYSIRFEDMTDPGGKTRIKYMTDGMLFRETLMDPLLTKYSVVMIDEAHERSLYTDILMGVLKKILKKRPDLRIIVSSATLDAEAFAAYFLAEKKSIESSRTGSSENNNTGNSNVAILSVEGRMYPVDIQYLAEPCTDYVECAIQTIFNIHVQEPEGDVLVIMTGRDEIETVVREIQDRATTLPSRAAKIVALAIYAGMAAEDQMLVFEPTERGTRKVVVATNIAEASITIDRIGFVIDCGFVKLKAYDPRSGMETLTKTAISQSSAKQRAGRAGRVRNGKAYRLYTQEFHDKKMALASIPEIQRSNLAGMVLQLKALGIENVLRFDFLTSPPAEMMSRALELLYSLKALDDYGRLTMPLGARLSEFPLDPMLGKILLDAEMFECSQEILTIAAMVSVENVFVNPTSPASEEHHRSFGAQEGDHITLLNVYNAFIHDGKKSGKWCFNHNINFKAMSRAVSIRSHLEKYLQRLLDLDYPSQRRKLSTCNGDTIKIRKCLTSGYFAQAARISHDGTHWISLRELGSDRKGKGASIERTHNHQLWMHPTSILFKAAPTWVLFHEVVETAKGKAYMREVTAIEPEWLHELAPHFYVMKKGAS